jgi:thiamine biosynthesis lipoprotein
MRMQEAARIARKLSLLEDMGLERVDLSPDTTEAVRVDSKTHKITKSRPAMGTLVSVSALARSKDRVEDAIGRTFLEMDRLIRIFSRFEGSSALTQLNTHARLDAVPPEFSHVVSRSLRFHGLSRGAFNISVEPLVDLFRKRLDSGTPEQPSEVEITEVMELVDARSIGVSRREIRFEKAGMGITLDGIAKGHIVDAMSRVLERHGVRRYLINAGGDIRAAGGKEHALPWTVAVKSPARDGCFPDRIHLTDGAVATSGSYEVYLDRDRQHHHIVSSKTGRSPTLSTSVTVVAPSALSADALATGVFVMDPPEGIAFIDGMAGCEVLIINREGRQFKSRGWRSATPAYGAEPEV